MWKANKEIPFGGILLSKGIHFFYLLSPINREKKIPLLQFLVERGKFHLRKCN
jgi:hypothetical protein